jgi:predicted transcriptional regulator
MTREDAILEVLRDAEGPTTASAVAKRAGLDLRITKITLRGLVRKGKARCNRSGSWRAS